MKPPDQVKREFVEQWLAKADDDLGAAEDMLTEDRPYRWIICYHAQQAAGEYLKSYLIHRDLEAPRVHDLADLLKLVASVDPDLARQLHEIRSLSIYAVTARYPGDLPVPTAEETREAVALASRARDLIVDAVREVHGHA